MTLSQLAKIAVLINGTSIYTEGTGGIKASFVSAVRSVSPNAQVDFYDPINAQIYPEPSAYDLIVLSGGTVDPMSQEPWVLKLQAFIRRTMHEHPRQKILGVCWGHQTIAVACGGVVGDMEKAEIGVTQVHLTAAGSAFLSSLPSSTGFKIHEFHKREVKTAGKGFIALAENSQSFINADNTILTFQGHPEMNSDLAKKMAQKLPRYMCVEGSEKEEIERRMESEHEGLAIWRRVLEWVQED